MPHDRKTETNICRALRALLSDIEGMYEGAEISGERGQPEEFFGPFSIGKVDGADFEGGISVSWPNLAISMRRAKEALRETDAEEV